MTTTQGLDDIFGYMPFDHFFLVSLLSSSGFVTTLDDMSNTVISSWQFSKDNWTPDSYLTQEAQEQTLVKTWVDLGRQGRSVRPSSGSCVPCMSAY